MKAAQILSLGSLLALIVALGIVLTGQQTEATKLLEPGAQGDASRSRAASDSVIGRGAEASAGTDLGTLVKATIYARVGEEGAGKASILESELKSSEPEIDLGKPLAAGGISMQVFAGGSSVVFCAKPDYYYVCKSINLKTRATADGKDRQLKVATKQAEIVGASSKPSAADATAGGAVNDAIREAEQLKNQGVR